MEMRTIKLSPALRAVADLMVREGWWEEWAVIHCVSHREINPGEFVIADPLLREAFVVFPETGTIDVTDYAAACRTTF